MHFLFRDHTTHIRDHAIPYIKQTGKSPEIIFPTELPRLSPFYNHTGQWSYNADSMPHVIDEYAAFRLFCAKSHTLLETAPVAKRGYAAYFCTVTNGWRFRRGKLLTREPFRRPFLRIQMPS